MEIHFCGFEESTTIGAIRERYTTLDNCNEISEFRKKFESKGLFDAIFSILLGGTTNAEEYRLNYIKTVYKKEKNDGSTWEQNAKRHTIGPNVGNQELVNFFERIEKNYTLEEVYNELQEWTKWDNQKDRKKIFLEAFEKGTDKMNLEGRDQSDEMIENLVSNNIEKNKQVIFTGAPGTGKTYSVREYVQRKCVILDKDGKKQYDMDGKLIVDEKQFKFVQFHPSYDYSDFVEGLRPVVLKGNTEPTFVRMDGVFKEFCRHIVEENENNKGNSKDYYFIVDEINRADLAKVFGELMFGLEESYRGESNKFDTQYKNLVTYKIILKDDVDNNNINNDDIDNNNINNDDIGKAIPIENDVFKDGFYIPENLYFIGTMNDIDRSVDSMDFALRRRFNWIDVKANDIMTLSLHSILDKDNSDEKSEKYKKIDDLAEHIIAMNKIISENNKFGLSEAYHIGPAYFKNLDINNDASLQDIFDTNIASILKEYTRGRKSEDVNTWIKACRDELLRRK